MAPAVINVTTFVDEDNGFLGGGTGISLREGVRYSAAGDTLQLQSGTYSLSLGGPGEDAGASGDLDIRHNLTITGPNACNAIIDGLWADRVLDVHPGVTLQMSNVEIGQGNAYADPGPDQNGGGIRVRRATLVLTSCMRIHDSYAVNGGGVSLDVSSTMRMLATQLFFNFAGRQGAGVWNSAQSTATIDRSAFRTNWATQGGAAANVTGSTMTVNGSTLSGNFSFAEGGGIYNNNGRLTIQQSAIDNGIAITDGAGIYTAGGSLSVDMSALYYNYAISDGGGIYLQGGSAALQNSTISSNYAQGNGGGIMRVPAAPVAVPLTMLHVTVTLNVATVGGGMVAGGVPLPRLTRNVVAENYNWALALSDVAGALDPVGTHNVLSDGLHGLPAATNVVTPLGFIGVLGSCFGPGPALGPAHDLLPGSPARDLVLGPPPPTLPTDQKGKPRGARPDSGACESSPAGPTPGGDPRVPVLDYSQLIENADTPSWSETVRLTGEPALTIQAGDDAIGLPAGEQPLADLVARLSQASAATQQAVDFAFQFEIV